MKDYVTKWQDNPEHHQTIWPAHSSRDKKCILPQILCTMCLLFNKFLVHNVILTIACEEKVFYLDWIKYVKNHSGFIKPYASKLCSTSKSLLENIHSWVHNVWDINDHKRIMNIPLKVHTIHNLEVFYFLLIEVDKVNESHLQYYQLYLHFLMLFISVFD